MEENKDKQGMYIPLAPIFIIGLLAVLLYKMK